MQLEVIITNPRTGLVRTYPVTADLAPDEDLKIETRIVKTEADE